MTIITIIAPYRVNRSCHIHPSQQRDDGATEAAAEPESESRQHGSPRVFAVCAVYKCEELDVDASDASHLNRRLVLLISSSLLKLHLHCSSRFHQISSFLCKQIEFFT